MAWYWWIVIIMAFIIGSWLELEMLILGPRRAEKEIERLKKENVLLKDKLKKEGS